MNKIVPVMLLILSVIGGLISIISLALVFLAFVASSWAFAAVIMLVTGCIINAFPLAGGLIFKGKICKAALIISSLAYILIAVGFIVLYSV